MQGAVREQAVNVRIVAATHQPLESLVQQGRFRADLYFRLNVVQLKAPPLAPRTRGLRNLSVEATGDANSPAANAVANTGAAAAEPVVRPSLSLMIQFDFNSAKIRPESQ